MNERVFEAAVIARAKLKSTGVSAEFVGERDDGTEIYQGLVEFTFEVFEYLKGGGGDELVAVATVESRVGEIRRVMETGVRGQPFEWRRFNMENPYTSMEAALEAARALARDRDTRWDGREAIIMLTRQPVPGSTDGDERYAFGRIYAYTIESKYGLWLPSAEPASAGASGTSSGEARFLLDATTQPETISVAEMRTLAARMEKWRRDGEGVEGHLKCIRASFWDETLANGVKESGGSTYLRYDHSLASGMPVGTVVEAIPHAEGSRVWLGGGDAELFEIASHSNGVTLAKRPLPAGEYAFYKKRQASRFIPCGYLPDRARNSIELFVSVTSPVGSLHEFFFDPVADGAAVAADATNGVLKPAAFTDANDAAATVSRIEWESGAVKMTVSPHTGLAGHFVDFIETDGSVSLSLAVSAATVDAANNALSWSATTQPWEDGDLLMVRIREPYAPAPTNLRSSRAGNGYLVAWNAVSGASQYALQTRIPGVQDWTDTTPFAEEDNQWYAPSQDLWCASSYEFRVRSYGDGIRYAAQWGEPSSVLVRDGHCNHAPEFSESAYSFSVAEDASSGYEVGTVFAADLDALSYSITAGNGDGKFAIGESSGVISVAGELDHATTPSYTLTVGASDGRSGTDSATVEIEILSVVVDYDADDDGLIEVSSLAQLDAVRWDLDGNGASTNASHAVAFPRASDGMGCPSTGCKGYELTADLDFDTDGDGSADSEDDYWNDGSGWDPIGDSSNEFRAIFDGNGRSLSNLFIDRDSTDRVGLFANTGGLSTVRNLRLVSVDVTGRDAVGGLVGYNNDSRVTSVCVSGDVAGRDYVGGITGRNDGAVKNGCSSAEVSGDDYVGGLVGWNYEILTVGYATGDVSGATLIGGLVGRNDAIMTNGYATGDVTASSEAGGLVGRNEGRITSGYATGDVTASSQAGGLVGSRHRRAQVSASYWDTGSSGLSASSGGVGKTTAELQSPTSAVGIYSAWDAVVWDFGTSAQYPAMKADIDGDSTSTLQEFGNQGR